MYPGKLLPAQEIYIIGQFFRIPPALHESNDAAISLTILIHQRRQFLPHRVFALLARVRIGTQNLQLHTLFHGRGRHRHRPGGQILSRPV